MIIFLVFTHNVLGWRLTKLSWKLDEGVYLKFDYF